MSTLLRIDTSARLQGSHTRELADRFQRRWQASHPDGEVVRRDLGAEPVPHLSNATIEAFHGQSSDSSDLALSDAVIEELSSADHLLIASPLYNLSVPSPLKAYLDHVVRSGSTFEFGKEGQRGLLENTSATLITARGGQGTPGDSSDFQTEYLRAILAYIGIHEMDVISVDGTSLEEAAREGNLSRAHRQIDQLFEAVEAPIWQGDFDDEEKKQISALRQAQATAIVRGDAEAYADLCTDDIQLMIPGRDVISGREAFLDAERALFAKATFARFEKNPLRVERQAGMAVEVGRQAATTHQATGAGGVYSAQQKYTHILRRTSDGWRFSVLMSNPSE